ncbi:hypothetical protein J5U22_01134 [Saccharolobus shibatae]|uniref:Uncharacterized protein n=1 Tax=Saccharolobus shibatae TaxID=2286 RepID=A0A8F5BUJ8_9CREN|nr:hypothetical protein J5U21_01221 [Saccharolobus shibatae]QXJ34588.1 hypothetical protein J5U22_01134 [Saccharolobus shibatae]
MNTYSKLGYSQVQIDIAYSTLFVIFLGVF